MIYLLTQELPPEEAEDWTECPLIQLLHQMICLKVLAPASRGVANGCILLGDGFNTERVC